MGEELKKIKYASLQCGNEELLEFVGAPRPSPLLFHERGDKNLLHPLVGKRMFEFIERLHSNPFPFYTGGEKNPLRLFAGEVIKNKKPTTRGKKRIARALRNRQTDAERRLWQRLRDRQLVGHKFRRQYQVGRYIVDFACVEKKLVVEIDGGQHADLIVRDAERTAFLMKAGFQVLRFWNNDVLRDTEAVLNAVLNQMVAPSSPTLLPQAGEGSTDSLVGCAGEEREHKTLRVNPVAAEERSSSSLSRETGEEYKHKTLRMNSATSEERNPSPLSRETGEG